MLKRNYCRSLLAILVMTLAGCVRPDFSISPIELPASMTTSSLLQETNQPNPTPRDGPAFSIIPDSELVNSPSAIGFDVYAFLQSKNGYLNDYREEVDGIQLSGADIVFRISRDYSVNPRILLSLVEHQSGWVTEKEVDVTQFPLGLMDASRAGLYRQLHWTADVLNRGYYSRRVNAFDQISLMDGQVVKLAPSINAGSVALHFFFAQLTNYHDWELAVSPLGIYTTHVRLFGDPHANTFDPLIPEDLQQPPLQLPFARGETWNFTSGPHSAWGSGAAWAALDFAPPGNRFGCYQSQDWVLASADGLIVRSEDGMVVQDLDRDGYEQSGWTILYQHIATRERIFYGSYAYAGDFIGHPSCEGGPSNGTHVHIARRYNGEWITADQWLPFNLDGWVSGGTGKEYDGTLTRDGIIVEAYAYFTEQNQISR